MGVGYTGYYSHWTIYENDVLKGAINSLRVGKRFLGTKVVIYGSPLQLNKTYKLVSPGCGVGYAVQVICSTPPFTLKESEVFICQTVDFKLML